MFETKKKELWSNADDVKTSKSKFVNTGMMIGAETLSDNGAKKYSEHSDDFVTQFNSMGTYMSSRSFSIVSQDQDFLWSQNKLMTVIFTFYIRMITRKVNLSDQTTDEVQRGGEMKHEGIMRMIWLHMKSPETFWKNISVYIAIGSWKDIFTMLQYDLTHHGWDDRKLDWDKFGKLILSGLQDDNQVNLIKKYLPQIKSRSKCITIESQANVIIGKWLCSLMFGEKNYAEYRKFKTSGTAHEWQQLISKGKHDLIDFNSIHGKALKLLSRSKYFENNNLATKYEEWIESKDAKDVKYTGFVHELFMNLPNLRDLDVGTSTTINKQFLSLVEKAKEKETSSKLIVVRDTSGSMSGCPNNINMSAGNIAKAMALYFSEFLEGKFADAWIEFNSTAEMKKWKGSEPIDKWYNDRSNYLGSTDFQSVIRLFINLKDEGVEEKDFPTGILCISDGEFNPSQLGKTNVESALNLLRLAGFSEDYVSKFIICLWNIPSYSNAKPKFETYTNVPNVFYMSGYSASTVSFLLDDIKDASGLFSKAMDQEILNLIVL